MTDTQEVQRPAPTLKGSDRFQAADFKISRYVAMVPSGTTLEEVLHPQYFVNHLDRMRSGMEITVLADDFSLDARIRVLTITKTAAKFRVLDVYAGGAADAEAPKIATSDVYVKFAGQNHKWRVMHGTTVIEAGFATEGEAKARAEKYLASING